VRTVKAVSAMIPAGDCVNVDTFYEEQVYRFRGTSNGSYVFKIFIGLDVGDVAQYLERKIFVAE
jgi:hypothetical protein